jgi:hypothetical protein
VAAITDFTGGHDIGVGINEQAMHRVYDHWWQHTTFNKTIPFSGTHDFDPPDFVDFLDEIADGVVDALSLGIVDVDVDLLRVWAEYGVTLRFTKFNFDLKPDNKVQVSGGSINADIWAKLKVKSKTTVSVFGAEVYNKEHTNTLFNGALNNITINVDTAEASVKINEDHQLTVDPETLDIDIPLEWDTFEFLLDYVVDWVVNMIVDGMPPIVLFPTIVSQKIPGTEATVTMSVEDLTINGTEALVAADLLLSSLSTYAPYVANKDSLEVHKRDCTYGKMIKNINRVYYCDLDKATKDGYDGCYYCLHELDHG